MNYNYQPPKHVIHLSDIHDPAYIQRYCRRNNILYMVYCIKWKDKTLKYGIQHKVASAQPGERLYTQVGWMPGWARGTLKRCPDTGLAIKAMIDLVEMEYASAFNKNDVTVEIMDFTGYDFIRPENRYAEMQNWEEHYKKLYFNLNGKFPIGNPKQEKPKFVASMFKDLFEVD